MLIEPQAIIFRSHRLRIKLFIGRNINGPLSSNDAAGQEISQARSSVLTPSSGPSPPASMNKEAPLSIAERDFILDALREGVRLDGRGADQLRPLTLSFGEEYGHVKVQLGKTRFVFHRPFVGTANFPSLVVRISAEVAKPHDDRPFDGIFNIAMELTAMGSPAWENGRYGCRYVYMDGADLSQ